MVRTTVFASGPFRASNSAGVSKSIPTTLTPVSSGSPQITAMPKSRRKKKRAQLPPRDPSLLPDLPLEEGGFLRAEDQRHDVEAHAVQLKSGIDEQFSLVHGHRIVSLVSQHGRQNLVAADQQVHQRLHPLLGRRL